MSRLSDAKTSARSAALKASGSFETKDARMSTTSRLMEHCWEKGYQVRDMDSIKGKHIASFINEQRETHSDRTLQNQMSHIRTSLRAVGREGLANDPKLSNKALGIDGASRTGSGRACTEAEYQKALADVRPRSEGVYHVLRLERVLGLRGEEAIKGAKTLGEWEKALSSTDQKPLVVYGTKGGHSRDVDPVDRQAALEVVREARAFAETQKGGFLIDKPTYTQANAHYRNVMNRYSDIRGHSIRKQWASERVSAYQEQRGVGYETARSATSMDLGHGPGRDSMMENVYLKK